MRDRQTGRHRHKIHREDWKQGESQESKLMQVSCCTHTKNNQTIRRSLVSYSNVCKVSPLKENGHLSSWMKSIKKVSTHTVFQANRAGRMGCLSRSWPSNRNSKQSYRNFWNGVIIQRIPLTRGISFLPYLSRINYPNTLPLTPQGRKECMHV